MGWAGDDDLKRADATGATERPLLAEPASQRPATATQRGTTTRDCGSVPNQLDSLRGGQCDPRPVSRFNQQAAGERRGSNRAEQAHVEDNEGNENFYGAESSVRPTHGSSPPAASILRRSEKSAIQKTRGGSRRREGAPKRRGGGSLRRPLVLPVPRDLTSRPGRLRWSPPHSAHSPTGR